MTDDIESLEPLAIADKLERMAYAVHLAAEPDVAMDISTTVSAAALALRSLKAERDERLRLADHLAQELHAVAVLRSRITELERIVEAAQDVMDDDCANVNWGCNSAMRLITLLPDRPSALSPKSEVSE